MIYDIRHISNRGQRQANDDDIVRKIRENGTILKLHVQVFQ